MEYPLATDHWPLATGKWPLVTENWPLNRIRIMIDDQHSLSNLRDIVTPDAPGFWPLAPGVWVVSGIVVAAAVIIFFHWLSLHKRNAYRRAGLALLDNAKTVHDISVLLKRVALAAFPREQVASLYGNDWVKFLKQTCPESRFSETDLTASNSEAGNELIKQAGLWIRRHRVNTVEMNS